jgi:hypothetical protein
MELIQESILTLVKNKDKWDTYIQDNFKPESKKVVVVDAYEGMLK